VTVTLGDNKKLQFRCGLPQ